MSNRSLKKERPLEIKSGSAVVKIYQTQEAGGYASHIAIYYESHRRKTRFFQDLSVAKAEAKKIADEIAQGEHISLDWNATEKLAIQRAREILAPIHIPIDAACRDFTDALRALEGTGTLLEACRDFAKRHPLTMPKIKVADAAELLVQHAKRDGKSEQRQSRLKSLLGRFGKAFATEVHTLTPKIIGDYLIIWLDCPLKNAPKPITGT